MQRGELRSFSVLALAAGAAAVLTAAIPKPPVAQGHADLPAPVITQDADGRIHIAATGGAIHYTLDGNAPDANAPRYKGPFSPSESRREERLLTTPTSVQWRHPLGRFPEACVVRACVVDDRGRPGAVAARTFVPERNGLPTVTLTLPPGALFDPDSGIYVVGDAILRTEEEAVQRYAQRLQKWWKYPGNFQFKGKRWQRSAQLAYSGPGGEAVFDAACALRINGNNTRGFPQHALRVTFEEPVPIDLFGDGGTKGPRALVLRASGNDQDRTFFRDALQHRLCEGLPFETAGHVPCVVYIDGAYWGLHNIRPRVDAKEIARRHGLRKKDVTILEDRLRLYDGDSAEVGRFHRFLLLAERWKADGPGFVDSLERHLDVDGFLTYIAAQSILGNTDWPDQNVKWWRYTGPRDTTDAMRDGRWRFIMGDSDMGLGLGAGPDQDMRKHLLRHASPTAQLFKACMRSPMLEQRFAGIMDGLLQGPLRAERMEAEARAMQQVIAAEMPRHIRRWRRPLTVDAWQRHVDELIAFVRERGAHVAAQRHLHAPPAHPVP